ncbi:hypothetical protein BT69DRAFT_1266300 [Atractiella rhizophila]|nr:hypothetical protein BT69DRAFT_1266300 [Atractiella rhizophila]
MISAATTNDQSTCTSPTPTTPTRPGFPRTSSKGVHFNTLSNLHETASGSPLSSIQHGEQRPAFTPPPPSRPTSIYGGVGGGNVSARSSRLSLSQSFRTTILAKKHTSLKVTWKERIRHFTFAAFTTNMATGGVTMLIRAIPFEFSGQRTVGVVLFCLNVCVFGGNCVGLAVRFWIWRKDFWRSVVHPREGMFVPACCLAFCLLLQDLLSYLPSSFHPLSHLSIALFILYLLVSSFFGFSIPFIMFIWPSHSLATMLPAWLLSIYPFLLVGGLAATVATIELEEAGSGGTSLWILLTGWAVSGAGFLVAQLYLASFILRLVQYGLPRPSQTPSMFIAAGVPSLTSVSFLRLSRLSRTVFPAHDFLGIGEQAGVSAYLLGVMSAVGFLSMGWWFFGIALLALLRAIKRGMDFSLTWWSCVFPVANLAFAVLVLADILDSMPLKVIGTVLGCLLFAGWVFILLAQAWAIYTRRIMHPEANDENFPIYRFAEVKSGLRASRREAFDPGSHLPSVRDGEESRAEVVEHERREEEVGSRDAREVFQSGGGLKSGLRPRRDLDDDLERNLETVERQDGERRKDVRDIWKGVN